MKLINLGSITLMLFSIITLNAKAEIIERSNGDLILINPNGTWDLLDGNSTIIYQGRSNILFEFKIWVDRANLHIETERNSFSGSVTFSDAWTGCSGGGQLIYSGSHDVVFKNFLTATSFIVYEFAEVGLLLGPNLETVYRPNTVIDISVHYTGAYLSTDREDEIDTLAEDATRMCNWKNLNLLHEPWASNVEVVFSDGSYLDNSDFWNHSRIVMAHRDTELRTR